MFGDVNNHWDLHRLVNASSAEVRPLHHDLYRSAAAQHMLVYLAVPGNEHSMPCVWHACLLPASFEVAPSACNSPYQFVSVSVWSGCWLPRLAAAQPVAAARPLAAITLPQDCALRCLHDDSPGLADATWQQRGWACSLYRYTQYNNTWVGSYFIPGGALQQHLYIYRRGKKGRAGAGRGAVFACGGVVAG